LGDEQVKEIESFLRNPDIQVADVTRRYGDYERIQNASLPSEFAARQELT
jgi:hypothetical protein